ncbi:MAG: MazG nucleotide pyrophosphohydrolase domain-containing protein [Planctomycetaceae bacterium]|jgi:NTP pyrophosphatase (non-canonical NTP hydrolase)
MSHRPQQQADSRNHENQIPPREKSSHPSLSALAAEIREINTSNGWNVLQAEEWEDDYKVPGILALIHSEVSEALEAFRAGDQENFVEEMADILIRVLDCAGGLTAEFDTAVHAKLDKNRQRGFRHGGKRV